jgi:hypothetical protein
MLVGKFLIAVGVQSGTALLFATLYFLATRELTKLKRRRE